MHQVLFNMFLYAIGSVLGVVGWLCIATPVVRFLSRGESSNREMDAAFLTIVGGVLGFLLGGFLLPVLWAWTS